ncbi:MAG: hypothetical protein KJ621_19235 [Proteobacteria bacterium]|nr:hypothetical protein [Pseudomonadota bacterium]MBU1740734.1 hypothetical protein [Pseudomonadota bacterium]
MAARARQWVLKNHTYKARLESIQAKMDQIGFESGLKMAKTLSNVLRCRGRLVRLVPGRHHRDSIARKVHLLPDQLTNLNRNQSQIAPTLRLIHIHRSINTRNRL